MKKIYLLACFLISMTAAMAQRFECDEINYQCISTMPGCVRVAEPISSVYHYTGELVIPGEVEFEGTTYKVVEIGIRALLDQKDLEILTAPEGVEIISPRALEGCSSLTAVNIPGVTQIRELAFNNCENLQSVDVSGARLTSIGQYAFNNCKSLTGIEMPESLISLGRNIFTGCTSLAEISWPASIMSIPEQTFYGCSSLKSVKLPATLNSIGEQAFVGCSSLSIIELWPENLENIGNYAFQGCTGLESIPELHQNHLAEGLFDGCSALKDVRIADDVDYIPAYAFRDCISLSEIALPQSLESIGERAFNNCSGLSFMSFPSVLKTIGLSAFEGCSGFTQLSFDTSDLIIDGYAFSNCRKLENLTLEGVATVGDYAFMNCTGLELLIGKDPLGAIGAEAFHNCSSLKNIFMWTLLPPALHSHSFDKTTETTATLSVQTGCRNLYSQSAYWSDFRNIEERNELPDVSSEIAIGDISEIVAERDGIRFTGLNGDTYVYSSDGILIAKAAVNPEGTFIALDHKGLVIVCLGNRVLKLVIK